MRRFRIPGICLLSLALAGCGSNFSAHNNTTSATPNPANPLIVNNTSAAASFVNQSNGNLGANNVSKMNIHSLLYAGATTKVLAHLLVWFGQSSHMNVGYSSNDPAQVRRQIEDMISRGIDGVVVDWYGPNNFMDEATQLVMQEAEKHTGFSFGIMIDAGAMAYACPGCPPQQALTQLLQYVEQKYFPSKAYLNIGGQPVVTEFNVDSGDQINWGQVNAALQVPPRFVFQDTEGFAHSMSDGSYSWVMPTYPDYGLDYLSSFYSTGMVFPNINTVGAAYKGFNDSLADWGSGRLMDQQCGQTFLQTFAKINSMYSTQRQLPYLQLVTWNDYEEGTEVESGIDGCFSLTASLSGNTLQWNITGNENTVDHYAVFISEDGQTVTPLTQVQPGVHSVDLCNLGLMPGNYQLYVQAVGKPMLANRLPPPVSYSPGCQ